MERKGQCTLEVQKADFGLIGCVGCERGTSGKRFMIPWLTVNGGAIGGNGNHKEE